MKPQVAAIESHLGYWLRFVSNHVSHAFELKVEAEGVTVAEWVLLREMLAMGEGHPSELAERLGMTRGAISKLVERASRKGLAEKALAEGDGRFQRVKLTAAGKKLVPFLARLADQNDHEFFGHMDSAQKAMLSALLQDIVRRNGWKEIPIR
jgi:DNA-binding MarR family transcriptional regulator